MVGVAGQVISDVVEYATTGSVSSGLEDYLGAAVGGAVGGAITGATCGAVSPIVAGAIENDVKTAVTQVAENISGKKYRSADAIFNNTVTSAVQLQVYGGTLAV